LHDHKLEGQTDTFNIQGCPGDALVCDYPPRNYLAALPEEVKQIIADAFTLMAART
jgi:hypothetical protein